MRLKPNVCGALLERLPLRAVIMFILKFSAKLMIICEYCHILKQK